MTTIVGLAGSLRRASFNRQLLTAIGRQLPEHVNLRVWDGLADLTLFNEDDEHAPTPGVASLRETIAGADGLIIATPEYNGSIPGGLKNAVDWASRPYGEGALRGKPVMVVGASVTPYGAKWAQEHLIHALSIAGAQPLDEHLPVSDAPRQFDENGELVDHRLRDQVRELTEGLLNAILAEKASA